MEMLVKLFSTNEKYAYYLNRGVTIDTRLSFKEHLRNAGLRASKVAQALVSIISNIRGLKQAR